jgi:hypothetical protein
MKKIITPAGKFGPYETVDVLEGRYRVNSCADLPFTVVGQGEISDVVDGDFPEPEPVVAPTPPAPTKEELLVQLNALAAQINALG